MSRDPEADRATLTAIHAAAVARDFPRATVLARDAHAVGLEHPMVLNLLALDLETRGELDAALPLLERAVALAPEDVGSINALGLCLWCLGRGEEALGCFDTVVRLLPEQAFGHAGRGAALQSVGRLALADESYVAALALQPDHPTALAGRAMIAALRGASAEARRYGHRALSVVPQLPDAVIAVAIAELAEGKLQAAAMRLRALISDARVAPADQAQALGVLGDVLDAAGQPHLAFVAYEECNQRLRQRYASRFAGAAALAYARDLVTYLDRTAIRSWSHHLTEGAPAPHVFLVGFPRSGTTLLEVVLDGHPDIVTLEEHESLTAAAHTFMGRPSDLDLLAQATESELEPFRAAYWDEVRRAGVDVAGKLFVDKYPLNTLKLPLIARLFPRARVLFAVRDPRDVVLSCFRRRFKMSAPFYELLTPEGAANYYDAVMSVAERCEQRLANPMRVVRHESVVEDFVGEMRALCADLGVEWLDSMADFAERAQQRGSATPSTAQLAAGLRRDGVGHWRTYRSELETSLPVLKRWVDRLGYTD